MLTRNPGNLNDTCDIEYHAGVRYLIKSHAKVQPNSMYNCPFLIYQWEYYEPRSMYPLYDIINAESISGPAFITPVFSSDNTLPNSSRPIRSDKFWHIERTFFDRAGWEDTLVTINVDTNIQLSDYEIVLPSNYNESSLDLYDVDENISSDESSGSINREYDDEDADF